MTQAETDRCIRELICGDAAAAAAHLAGHRNRVETLARDHLADHPDSVLVAWIAAAARTSTVTAPAPGIPAHHETEQP